MLHPAELRYVKASIICGVLAFLVSAGLFELGVFLGLDAALALFVEQSSPPVVGSGLQYALMLVASLGIAWTTIDVVRFSLKFAVVLVALAECVTAVWVANLFDCYFSPFATAMAIVLSFAMATLYSTSAPGRRKQRLSQLIGNRVSAQTFDSLLNSDIPLQFDGDVRDASVVVCEVLNHGELMGEMRTSDHVAMTNSFLRNSADFLVEKGGYLDECDGECVRVVFGAPLPELSHAFHACEAALALAERLDAVNKECKEVWGKTFDFRIAINSGEMVVAAYGSGRIGTLSVAGEPVEFARRLCSANLIYGSRILVGANTFNEAEDRIEVRPMEMIQRGSDSSQREEVYELLGRTGTLPEPERMRREVFWKGLIAYRGKRWDEALAHFQKAAEVAGPDGPSEFYIRRIGQIRAGGPLPDWSGTMP